MKNIVFAALIFVAIVFGGEFDNAYGMELEEYDFSAIDRFMESENFDFDFYGAAAELSSGENSVIKNMAEASVTAVKNEFEFNREVFSQIIGLAVAAALLGGFANIFGNSGIGNTGFGIIYMFLVIVLMAGFSSICTVSENILDILLKFMKLLLPTYFMSVGMAGNVNSSVVFYEITLAVIMITEWMFLRVFIPLVKIRLIITIIDNISNEKILSKISGLINKVISWMLKTSIALVTGVNLIEGIVVPSADSAAVNTLGKFTSVIPGVGNSASALSGIALGAGNLIKNSIGGAALAAIVVVAVIPSLKVGASAIMYQLISGVLQPLTDRRITDSVSAVGNGIEMLFKIVLTVALLFIITIAIICISTNQQNF